MSNNAIQRQELPSYIESATEHYGKEAMRLLRDTIARDLTLQELGLFVEVCRRTGLDPFAKHVYAVKRYDKRMGREVMTIQLGIDGFRSIAERTGRYAGQRGPYWCGEDGEWKDVWLSSEPPKAAKVEVIRSDFQQPLIGVALWSEYAQQYGLWSKLPTVMLAKCAESIALRRSFPQELSGLYTTEEMSQADIKPEATYPTQQNHTEQTRQPEATEAKVIEINDEKPKQEPPAKKSGSSTKILIDFMNSMDTTNDFDALVQSFDRWEETLSAIPERAMQRAKAYYRVKLCLLSNEEPAKQDTEFAEELAKIRPQAS